jgi:aryl-alcohol dehydrogenase-like predicted oxidoreductase
MSALSSVTLGGSELNVTRLGMGCWAIGGHGWGPVRDEDSIRAIRHAVECGCNFFDTADVYGLGHSELILREALAEQRSRVVIATKGGVRWDAAGNTWRECSPGYMSMALDESRRRLGLDVLPLYYVHWPDDVTPVAVVIEAMARFREQGKIGALGVSNFTGEQLRAAIRITRIDAIQIKFSILERNQALSILTVCRKNGITPVFYGVLADGLLTGKFSPASTFRSDDHRSRMPDFQGQRFLDNLRVVEAIRSTAAAKKATLGQIALRWVLDKVEGSAVLFGAKKVSQVDEDIHSADVLLSAADRRFISNLNRPPDARPR